MADTTPSAQVTMTSPVLGYLDGTNAGAVNAADGTFFNTMVNNPNPALLAKDVAELQGQLVVEQQAETKRHMREGTEITKAALATRLYQSQQQTQISLAKEAIEICKQA